MEPTVDAQAGNVSGEPSPRAFDVVLRGYDRREVDKHIEQLENQARQHRDQVQALQRELAEAHRQLREQEQERPTSAGFGSRIEQLLSVAGEHATELVQAVRSAADEIEAEARAAAAGLRAAAENEAAELRASAKRETDGLRASAEGEADAIKAHASAQADQAKREAEQAKSEAEQYAQRYRAAAQRELDELTRRKDSIASQLAQISQLFGAQVLTSGEPEAKPAQPATPGGQELSSPPR